MKKSKLLQNAERDLARAVKNYNAILQRAIKSGRVPEAVAPVPESVRKIKAAAREMSAAEQRAYYREQIRILKKIKLKTAFDVVESPSGAKTTKYELRRTKAAIRKENISRAKRAEAEQARPVVSGGRVIKGAKRVAEKANLKPIKFDFSQKSKKDWDEFRKAARKMERPKGGDYLQSLKKAVKNNVSAKYARLINQELDRIGASGVQRAYENGEEWADIDFYYFPSGSDDDTYFNILCTIRSYDISDYFQRWKAKVQAAYKIRSVPPERYEDFMNAVRRFAAHGLKNALLHYEKWAALEFHDKPTAAKFYETWGGINNYI